jgi:hypothetical protein
MLHQKRENARASCTPETGEAASTRRVRPKSIALAGVAGALLIGVPTVLVGVGSPAAAVTTVPAPVPTFPENLNVFPNRDFVSIDGYADHAGQAATIKVTRGDQVVGAAVGTVSGGDVAFEVNHPGGICWGNAPGTPNVTPDILPGDVVSIWFNGVAVGATTVQDVQAFDAVQVGKTVTVGGHIGPGVDPLNIEQRIIEPALRDTVVNKRDVRAVPGDLATANKGGYSSSLTIDRATQTFVATYIFDTLDAATIAANAGLGERAMAWEITDADANRQGMTIAENGEPGGPGMGGCPNGPLQSGPPGPTNIVAGPLSSAGTVKVNWTPAVSIPGAPAIQGYRVTAVGTADAIKEQVEIGKKIANPDADGTTIIGLDPTKTYDIEVVSYSSAGETFPAVHPIGPDTTAPKVTVTPAGGSYAIAQQVTLTADEPADIWYTTDGSDLLVNGDLDTTVALPYTGPITIDKSSTLKFAAFDTAVPANVSTGSQNYVLSNQPVPAAPATVQALAGAESVALNWSPADPGAPSLVVTQYKVDVFATADATQPMSSVTVNGDVTSTTIPGLTGDVQYWFAVSAKNNVNSAFGPASAKTGPVTPTAALKAVAGPDQTNVTRGTVVRLSGLGSTGTNAQYAWAQLPTGILATDPNAVALTPVPGTNGRDVSFTLPFFKFGMSNQALTFRLTVTVNGTPTTDDVVITPHVDTIIVTKAQWKVGDFRVTGTGVVGSTLTARTANGTVLASGTVAAGGTFDLRNRANLGAAQPVFVDSNMGGTVGPTTPTT